MDNAYEKKAKSRMLRSLMKHNSIVSKAVRESRIEIGQHERWLKGDPDYYDAVRRIEETVVDFVEEKLYENIDKGNVQSIVFFLKTKGKSRGYNEKVDINVTGSIGMKPLFDGDLIHRTEIDTEIPKTLNDGIETKALKASFEAIEDDLIDNTDEYE